MLIASYPVVARTFTLLYLSRVAVRYGDYRSNPIAAAGIPSVSRWPSFPLERRRQSVIGGWRSAERRARPALPDLTCQRAGGEPYTTNWPGLLGYSNVAKLKADRPNGCWTDSFGDAYWNAIIGGGSHTGSAFGQTWLNQSSTAG